MEEERDKEPMRRELWAGGGPDVYTQSKGPERTQLKSPPTRSEAEGGGRKGRRVEEKKSSRSSGCAGA